MIPCLSDGIKNRMHICQKIQLPQTGSNPPCTPDRMVPLARKPCCTLRKQSTYCFSSIPRTDSSRTTTGGSRHLPIPASPHTWMISKQRGSESGFKSGHIDKTRHDSAGKDKSQCCPPNASFGLWNKRVLSRHRHHHARHRPPHKRKSVPSSKLHRPGSTLPRLQGYAPQVPVSMIPPHRAPLWQR